MRFVLCALALVVVGCSAPQPSAQARTPTAQVPPGPVDQPSPRATADSSRGSPADAENAFLSNVDDVVAEANDLAVASCADLTRLTNESPNLLPSVRGVAAALKRVGGSQPVLDTQAVKFALSDLDRSITDMEATLSQCGISQP